MSNKVRQSPARRRMFTGAAALAGLAILPRARAAAKASKASLQYQDHPKDGKDCDDCLQFVPGKSPKATGTCKVVDGPISPHGWCLAFVKKP